MLFYSEKSLKKELTKNAKKANSDLIKIVKYINGEEIEEIDFYLNKDSQLFSIKTFTFAIIVSLVFGLQGYFLGVKHPGSPALPYDCLFFVSCFVLSIILVKCFRYFKRREFVNVSVKYLVELTNEYPKEFNEYYNHIIDKSSPEEPQKNPKRNKEQL